jgi:uncharacterized protein YndB with AHSA1/START domain
MIQENAVLMVQRKINASAERLFDAWTKPALMKKWFHSSEKSSTPMAETDLKVGGAWKIEMANSKGQVSPCFGEYKVIDRPHKLVFTWSPTCGKDDYMTTVTLLFKKVSDTVTELTLTHEGLRNEEEYKSHNGGWDGCLGMLGKWANASIS